MVCIVVILVEYQLTPGRLGTESHEDVIILNKKKKLVHYYFIYNKKNNY